MAEREGYSYTPASWQESSQSGSSETKQSSETGKTLDEALLARILAGLNGQMTDEEISEYARMLMEPQLNAELEASQQQYETTRQAKEQEIANLESELRRGVEQQNAAYRQSMADVDTAALARGMGRSSYTLQTLANQGDALAKAVMELTRDAQDRSSQIQQQITLAAQQNAQTQGRLKTDYATNLAAKVQELRQTQREQANSNYMTAVSEALGSKTSNQSATTTTDTSRTDAGTAAAIVPEGTGGGDSGGGSSGSKKNTANKSEGTDIITTVNTRPINGSWATNKGHTPK